MSDMDSAQAEEKFFNLGQIVALDLAATVSLFFAAHTAGLGMMASLLGAWIGGAALTFAGVAGVYHMRMKSLTQAETALQDEASAPEPGAGPEIAADKHGPALVPDSVSDPVQVWEEDLNMEIDYAINQLGQPDRSRKPRPAAPVEMVPMWDEDAEQDAMEARVTPKRAQRRERRKDALPYIGKERRVANR